MTLKQLENSTFLVQNKDNCNALAEMFNIELNFTIGCLKSWFQQRKVLKLDEETFWILKQILIKQFTQFVIFH